MKRFEDETIEEIYWTRFAPNVPEHVSVAAHKIARPLVAACSLQDVDVFGPILRWANAPARLGVHVDGKWHLTFVWCEDLEGAFGIQLERR